MRTRDIEKVELVKQKAIEMIVRDGFEGFSVNKLAKACGISVATLYIYYRDKEDLIKQLAREKGKEMGEMILEGFDPALPFEEGLRIQWQNRFHHAIANPNLNRFFEELRNSRYQESFLSSFIVDFRDQLGKFMHNAVERGEILALPLEVYWSIAFAPLYNLLRFHHQKQSLGGKLFNLNNDVIWQTFDLVVKALKK